MNDINTIREALEEYAHRQWCAENGTAAKADSVLKSVDAALAALERVSALQAEMEAELAELRGEAANLKAVQDFGADWDLYAEPNGKWSIRERSGEITTFDNLGECGSALRNQNSR